MAVAIYTCDVGGVDWPHRPQARTPGARLVRFADAPARRSAPWEHAPLPAMPGGLSPRLRSRYPKILPHRVLPEAEINVWVDGNVVILADLTPLIDAFRRSGADMALFAHPSGRTVSAEIDAARERGLVGGDGAAEALRRRYAAAGVLDTPVTENAILFRRAGSLALEAAMERWWAELTEQTERDQICLAHALSGQGVRVHRWDWHFDDPGCPWFRRVPHRPADLPTRLLTGAHFLGDYRADYRMLRGVVRTGGRVRRRLSLPALHSRLARARIGPSPSGGSGPE